MLYSLSTNFSISNCWSLRLDLLLLLLLVLRPVRLLLRLELVRAALLQSASSQPLPRPQRQMPRSKIRCLFSSSMWFRNMVSNGVRARGTVAKKNEKSIAHSQREGERAREKRGRERELYVSRMFNRGTPQMLVIFTSGMRSLVFSSCYPLTSSPFLRLRPGQISRHPLPAASAPQWTYPPY